MFKFLKDKLKGAVSVFSKKAKEEVPEEEKIEEKEIKVDERAIKEEEKRLEEEKKKKEWELKELEKKKKGEEKKRKEEEKKREEEEEKRKKEEIEKAKKEEAELKKIKEEEERIRKEAELQKRKEELKKKEEEQQKREEEERRNREEVEKELEEERKKKEGELRKIEEKEKKIEETKSFFKRLKEKFRKTKEIKGEVIKEKDKDIVIEEFKEEKQGFFAKVKEKITTKKISAEKFDELFWDLEMALLENNVAVEVIEKIKNDLKENLVDVPIIKSSVDQKILDSLKKSIEDLFQQPGFDLVKEIKKSEKPYIIVFVGINGSGKTTTIAKMAHMLKKNGLSCVMVAGDTWRQAAIEQLEEHGRRLGIKVVKHNYGSDPAAVAFDGIKMAKARNIDVVLVDTAGRMHSNINLIAEMEKIVRVAKPNLKLFIGESITGNDCVEQAKVFNEAIDLDGIILAKADIDEKGGAAVSISYVTGKPILFLGVGQGMNDLKKFNKDEVLKTIGL